MKRLIPLLILLAACSKTEEVIDTPPVLPEVPEVVEEEVEVINFENITNIRHPFSTSPFHYSKHYQELEEEYGNVEFLTCRNATNKTFYFLNSKGGTLRFLPDEENATAITIPAQQFIVFDENETLVAKPTIRANLTTLSTQQGNFSIPNCTKMFSKENQEITFTGVLRDDNTSNTITYYLQTDTHDISVPAWAPRVLVTNGKISMLMSLNEEVSFQGIIIDENFYAREISTPHFPSAVQRNLDYHSENNVTSLYRCPEYYVSHNKPSYISTSIIVEGEEMITREQKNGTGMIFYHRFDSSQISNHTINKNLVSLTDLKVRTGLPFDNCELIFTNDEAYEVVS